MMEAQLGSTWNACTKSMGNTQSGIIEVVEGMIASVKTAFYLSYIILLIAITSLLSESLSLACYLNHYRQNINCHHKEDIVYKEPKP